MSEHVWEVDPECSDFWICRACGSSGDPLLAAMLGTSDYDGQKFKPFLAGEGLDLSQDCDESKLMIENFKRISNLW